MSPSIGDVRCVWGVIKSRPIPDSDAALFPALAGLLRVYAKLVLPYYPFTVSCPYHFFYPSRTHFLAFEPAFAATRDEPLPMVLRRIADGDSRWQVAP